MRDTSPRWRRSVELLAVLVTVAFVSLRRRERAADATDDGPELAVELERVTVGDGLSVTGAGLDPTLIADVMGLNEGAADLVDATEEGLIREPIETATGAEVPDVEDELARRVRESTVPETALDELETLGGIFGLGGRRRRRRRREQEAAEDGNEGPSDGADEAPADDADE